ncbi:hypothetical protein [Alcanivorax jadensis]|uniref:hypothetical protein n=1 Tax=Alcanivorax jadensis TaxID=64988 RepID=UPI003561AF44
MGKFSKAISERFKHTKIKDGYCLICGNFGPLTQDHVPPQGSITISKIEQRHVVEVIGKDSPPVRGVLSPNGSKFKTICSKCNNEHIGANDEEIAKVNRKLTVKINEYFSDIHSVISQISVDVDPIKYARAMAGHILAATSVMECKSPPVESEYFDPIKKFVLGDDEAINKTHDIYYWFYPFNRHISAKFVGFRNEGHLSFISLLSFFPIAFMLTKKNEGTFPSHARKIEFDSHQLFLDLSSQGAVYSEFPFCGLKGNQMMLLNGTQAIVSYPVGQ